MDDRANYRTLVERYPDLFRNPPGAAFEILLDEALVDAFRGIPRPRMTAGA